MDLAWAANGAAKVKGASRRCECLAMRGAWCERQVRVVNSVASGCLFGLVDKQQSTTPHAARRTPRFCTRTQNAVHAFLAHLSRLTLRYSGALLHLVLGAVLLIGYQAPKTNATRNGGLHLQGGLGTRAGARSDPAAASHLHRFRFARTRLFPYTSPVRRFRLQECAIRVSHRHRHHPRPRLRSDCCGSVIAS